MAIMKAFPLEILRQHSSSSFVQLKCLRRMDRRHSFELVASVTDDSNNNKQWKIYYLTLYQNTFL